MLEWMSLGGLDEVDSGEEEVVEQLELASSVSDDGDSQSNVFIH
jgi:hypothetical protein